MWRRQMPAGRKAREVPVQNRATLADQRGTSGYGGFRRLQERQYYQIFLVSGAEGANCWRAEHWDGIIGHSCYLSLTATL